MFCPKCGTPVPDNPAFCPGCGNPLAQQYQQPVQVTNWFVPSILVTIFCCLPVGIPAIVYAAKANGLAARGNYEAAQRAANCAKIWHWVAFGIGLPLQILVFLAQETS